MTDEPDPPPIVLPFPAPVRDAMSERGAKTIAPPAVEPEAPRPFVTESPDKQLRYILQISLSHGQSLEWAIAHALAVIDTKKSTPELMRFAARQHLLRIAEEAAGEEPSLRASAVFASIAYNSDRQKPFEPPPTADVKLDLSLLGVCNLCGKRPSDQRGFTLRWFDSERNGDIVARYCGECVATAVANESRRKFDDTW